MIMIIIIYNNKFFPSFAAKNIEKFAMKLLQLL